MVALHPLLEARTKSAIEREASLHLGRTWVGHAFTDLNDRASHPCGVLHGEPFSVFAKLDRSPQGAEKFGAELSGLTLVREEAQIATPTPIGTGLLRLDHGVLLLAEALSERAAPDRSAEDWRSIGQTLATLHQVHGPRFGLDGLNGFYGPLPQDNTPVSSNGWIDFYTERRVIPFLRSAVDAGHLPMELATDVERLLRRLPSVCGPEPRPTLLHGDAQQNNFVTTDGGAVVVDVAPYYGHPEIDLALLDYFQPVPGDVLAAYREITPIEPGFGDRRELWRLFAYLAGITVADTSTPFGRHVRARLAEAVGSAGGPAI